MTNPQGDVLAGHKNGGEVLFGLVDVAIHRFLLQSCFKCLPEASRLDLPIASGEQHIGACPMIGLQVICCQERKKSYSFDCWLVCCSRVPGLPSMGASTF